MAALNTIRPHVRASRVDKLPEPDAIDAELTARGSGKAERTRWARERAALLRDKFDESDVTELAKFREALAEKSGGDKEEFTKIVHELLQNSPDLREGLTSVDIDAGVEYLWNPRIPIAGNPFTLKPFDSEKLHANITNVGFRDYLPWGKKKGEAPAWDRAIERRLPWYLRLPYRMIKKRIGGAIEKKAEELAGKDVLPGPKDEPKAKDATPAKEAEKRTPEQRDKDDEDKLFKLIQGHSEDLRGLRADLKKLRDDLGKEIKGTKTVEDLEKLKKYNEKNEEQRKKIETRIEDREVERGDALRVLLASIEKKLGQSSGSPQQIGQQNIFHGSPAMGGGYQAPHGYMLVPEPNYRAPASAVPAPARQPEAAPDNRSPFQIADDLKKLREGMPAEATPTEITNATTKLDGRTDADYAKFVAEKTKGNPDKVKGWMSAIKRWPIAIFSGLFTGISGYTAGFLGGGTVGTIAGSLGVPASMLGSLGTISLPLLGSVALPALPVVFAALAGVAAWQLIGRRIVGLKELDERANEGWQAKKLMKSMEKSFKRGDTPDAQKHFDKIKNRATWRRAETIPRIFGAILGGGIAADYWTGSSVVKNTAIGTYEFSKGLGKGAFNMGTEFWNNPKWPSWLSGGEPISSSATPTDYTRATAALDGDLYERLYNDVATRAGQEAATLPSETPPTSVPIYPGTIGVDPPPTPTLAPGPPTTPDAIPPEPAPSAKPEAATDPDVRSSPAPGTETAPPISRGPRWVGLASNVVVQTPSGGIERIIDALPAVNTADLNFGTGNPSVTTDIWRRIMYETPQAWQDFFGEYVPGRGMDAFEYKATRLHEKILDYSVLNKTYEGMGGKTPLDKMIQYAQEIGPRGQRSAEVFQQLQSALKNATPDINLKVLVK